MYSQSTQGGVNNVSDSTDSHNINEAGGLSSLQSFLFDSLKSTSQASTYLPSSLLISQQGTVSPSSSESATPRMLASHRQNMRSTINIRRAPSSVVDTDFAPIKTVSPSLSVNSQVTIHTPQVHHQDLSKPPPAPRVSQLQDKHVNIPRQLSPQHLSPHTPNTNQYTQQNNIAPSPLLFIMADDLTLTKVQRRKASSKQATPTSKVSLEYSPANSTPKHKYRLKPQPGSPQISEPQLQISTEDLKKNMKKLLEKILIRCIENTLPRTNPLFLDVYKKAYKRVRMLPACQKMWGSNISTVEQLLWAKESTCDELAQIFPQISRESQMKTMVYESETPSKRRKLG